MPENAQIVETVTTLYERLFRPDIERLRSEMGQIEAHLRGEIVATAQGLRDEMGQVETRLRGDMGEMGQSLRGEMGQIEARLRGEVGDMGQGLRGEIVATAQGLRDEMGQVEARLRGEVGDLSQSVRGEMRVMQADIAALRKTTSEMQADAADFHRDADTHFDAVYQRFDRLETEYHMLVEGLRRVERQVATDATERSAIRAQIRNLEDGMTDLRSRLSA
jgi:chromosome segregation ATPase